LHFPEFADECFVNHFHFAKTTHLDFAGLKVMARTMTDFPFAIVGFDLDGTLLDSSYELAASLNHALASIGRPPIATNGVKALVGMGTRHMLKLGLEQSGGADDETVHALHPVLVDHYRANLGSNCPPFPGLESALDQLAATGTKLAVVTNKFESLAVELLGNVGLADRFVTIIGGDTMGKGNGKPKPDPIHEMIRRCGGGPAAFVGDTIHDVHAAQAAGIKSIAVSFGFLDQPAEQLGADAVIGHYQELFDTLQRLG
jgi:phosphoglycolate phosphatase